jgi:predicted MFS family arabinose efflux permease
VRTTPQRRFALTLIGIGAASTAAHLGNNFTTYLIGGLMDRFGFSPTAMGAWNMAETLSYAAAMFLVAPRARAMDARILALLATVLVATTQASSALMTTYPLLLLGRIGTGLGFGIMNSAVNLAAGRTAHPARSISMGIAFQTIMFAAINIGLPIIGKYNGVAGMFIALAGLTIILGVLAMMLPGGTGLDGDSPSAKSNTPIGADGRRVLVAMALFAFGTLAIWPFMERTARAIGLPATQFGRYQSLAVLISALGNVGLAVVVKRLPRTWPLAAALGACGLACALLTTVGSEAAFAAALIAFNVSWFLTYPLLLGLAYSIDGSGRLAVMTTGTWLLSQSFGSLAAGGIAQNFGGYTLIGPMGALICLAAIAVALPIARRLDGRSPDAGRPSRGKR